MAASDTAPESSPLDRRLETPRAAGVAGLAFAGLFAASILLLRNHPSAGSTAAEIQDFYLGEHAARVSLVGVYLAPFSGIAFLWFIAAVRNLIGDREDRFFATVFLGSGLLITLAAFAAFAATWLGLAWLLPHGDRTGGRSSPGRCSSRSGSS